MKVNKKKKQEYNSFKEYKRAFYPSSERKSLQMDNPYQFGVNLAKESLNKFRHLLPKR